MAFSGIERRWMTVISFGVKNLLIQDVTDNRGNLAPGEYQV